MSDDSKVIIALIANKWEGLTHSVIWLFALSVTMAVAVWLESVIMQGMICILWTLCIFEWVSRISKKNRFTPAEAIKEIERIIASKSAD